MDGFNSMGLDCFAPGGAFYTFPSIARTGLSASEFCERLLREEQVAVIPGDAFGRSGEGFVRACYAVSEEKLEIALERMGRFVRRCEPALVH